MFPVQLNPSQPTIYLGVPLLLFGDKCRLGVVHCTSIENPRPLQRGPYTGFALIPNPRLDWKDVRERHSMSVQLFDFKV